MLIKKSGIFKTIDSKDFGIFQPKGWEKVIAEPIEKIEAIKVEEEPIEEESIEQEPIEQEPIEQEPIEQEIQLIEEEEKEMPKSKKKKK